VNDLNLNSYYQIYIALGTNLGDRVENLRAAIEAMQPVVTILSQSPVYQTIPWGYTDQPDFLNQVVFGTTRSTPMQLLTFLKEVETRIGRVPTFQNGPRKLDLDILFYSDLIVNLPGLRIPHPRLPERAFVLVPLNDIAPNFIHPTLHQSVAEMLSKLDISGVMPFRPSHHDSNG